MPNEGGESLELVGEEAARRLVGQFAGRRVDLCVDLSDDDLGLVQGAGVEEDEDVAQVKLRAQAAEEAGRGALNRDRLAGERLVG